MKCAVAVRGQFSPTNKLEAWIRRVLSCLPFALRTDLSKRQAHARWHPPRRRGTKSYLPMAFVIIALSLLGSALGYLMLLFHQD